MPISIIIAEPSRYEFKVMEALQEAFKGQEDRIHIMTRPDPSVIKFVDTVLGNHGKNFSRVDLNAIPFDEYLPQPRPEGAPVKTTFTVDDAEWVILEGSYQSERNRMVIGKVLADNNKKIIHIEYGN